jgi:hypothetical protein
MNLQETSQLLSESLLDPDVFMLAAEDIDICSFWFSCVRIDNHTRYLDRGVHVRFFTALFGLTGPDGDGYTFASPAFWEGASEEELQPIRVLCLLFASHAARDHNRSVRARLSAQKRKLTKVTS